MAPALFASKPPPQEQKDYSNAILFGYKSMDSLVGDFIRLADGNTTLLFATALSQQPYLDREETGGRNYYHLIEQSRLSNQLKLPSKYLYEPVMAEQFILRYFNLDDLVKSKELLSSYFIDDPSLFPNKNTRLFNVEQRDNGLVVQCRCTSSVPKETTIKSSADEAVKIQFYDVFYRMSALKSGRHHPAGMFWVRHATPRHCIHRDKVSIRSIAPTILSLFNVPAASHMRAAALCN